MKITIEISAGELRELLTQQEQPEITDEIHENFAEDPYEPEPEPEPQPKARVRNTKAAKPVKRGTNKRGGKPHPVDVKVGDEWRTFPSTKEAAVYLGCPQPQVSSAISRGIKCRGHELRYSPEEPDNDILPRGGRNG